MPDIETNNSLKALLLLFDRYVLTEEAGKYHFSGEIFEYSFSCEVPESGLIRKLGDFLMTVPKYMWNLKQQDSLN